MDSTNERRHNFMMHPLVIIPEGTVFRVKPRLCDRHENNNKNLTHIAQRVCECCFYHFFHLLEVTLFIRPHECKNSSFMNCRDG